MSCNLKRFDFPHLSTDESQLSFDPHRTTTYSIHHFDCTILYNAHSILHNRDADTTITTTVTTIGESGDTLAGFIHWPRRIDQRAVVIVGGKQLRLTPLDSRDDAMCLPHVWI